MANTKPITIGSCVFWNDPDGGICSGFYMVTNLGEETATITANGSVAEVPYHELKVY